MGYKGKDKLKSANEAQCGFPGFDPPSITKTTPKTSGTTTASFLKKAMSKSASPKLKKSKIEKIKKLETLTMSEPKKKKVNFALTMNKSQHSQQLKTELCCIEYPDQLQEQNCQEDGRALQKRTSHGFLLRDSKIKFE